MGSTVHVACGRTVYRVYFSRWLAKLKDKLDDGNIKADWDIMLVAIFMEYVHIVYNL